MRKSPAALAALTTCFVTAALPLVGPVTVQLQWRSAGGTYRTVKNVTTGKNGIKKARVKATRDGCFRYVFPGSKTTVVVTSRGDCLDVK